MLLLFCFTAENSNSFESITVTTQRTTHNKRKIVISRWAGCYV